MIHSPREHEEQIREAIDVTEDDAFDRRLEGDDAPLGATADGPRHMQRGARLRSAGQDEAAERRSLGLEPIDQLLEPEDIAVPERDFGDASGNSLGWISEARAKGEQIALEMLDDGIQFSVEFQRAHETKPRVQLVDFAIGVNAAVGLADARLVEERRLASVTRPRVEFHRVKLYAR